MLSKNIKNLIVTLLLIGGSYFIFKKSNTEKPEEIKLADPTTKQGLDEQVKNPGNGELPPPTDIREAMKKMESTNPQDLPEDLKQQLNAPEPELPDDLKKQLEMPPQELPEDLKAQLNGPPPEIPEDIKEALKIPPRITTIEEVNGVPAETPQAEENE